jgi:hypothetical protein
MQAARTSQRVVPRLRRRQAAGGRSWELLEVGHRVTPPARCWVSGNTALLGAWVAVLIASARKSNSYPGE